MKLEEILTDQLTLVDYYADWCGPCKMLALELAELKDINIIKVDVEKEEELALSKNIMTIPYVEIYKDKELVIHFNGFKTKAEIEEIIKTI